LQDAEADASAGRIALGHLGRGGLNLDGRSGHHTISRTRTAAALPSVIGGPGLDFIRGGALSLLLLAAGHIPLAAAGARGSAAARAARQTSDPNQWAQHWSRNSIVTAK
jgi:hypothetical protein